MPLHIRLTVITAYLSLSTLTAFSQKPELYVQTGHSERVRAIAFSPNGQILASGGDDSKIKLWEVATGKEVKTLVGHFSRVVSVTFSPDGKTLASTGKDEEVIKFWDVETGSELRTIKGVLGESVEIHFTPDGKSIVSGSSDGGIKMWEIATGKELRIFQTEDEGATVTSVSISHDGKILARAETSDPSEIKLWDLTTGKELKALESGHNKCIDQLIAFAPTGRTLISATNAAVEWWDVTTGTQLSASPIADNRCTGELALSPHLRFLARIVANDLEIIKLVEVATGKELRTLQVSEDRESVESITFSPDSTILASGDTVGKITLWDVATGKELRTLKGHSSPNPSVAFSPNGKVIASGSLDGTIKLWATSTWGITTLTGHSEGVTSVAFSPDGKTLASGSLMGTIKLWDVVAARELRTLESPKSSQNGIVIAFSPDGKTLASLDSEAIRLWDVISGKELKVFKFQGEPSLSVSFSPDGKVLACGVDQTIKLWDVTTGEELKTLKGHSGSVGFVIFSPDRKTLASSSKDSTIRLWDVVTGKELKTIKEHLNTGFLSIAFSTDGQMLASSNMEMLASNKVDKTVSLWDVVTGKELKNISLNSDFAVSVTFSPDGKTLASGSLTGRTYLWDVISGTNLASLIALDEKDWAIITPDGRFDGSPDGVKLLHYVQANKAIPLDSFFEQFYTPKLLQQVYARETTQVDLALGNTPKVDFSKPLKLPPIVRITSPQPGAISNSNTAQIVVEVVDQGGGVEDIKLYQNGKLVAEESRKLELATTKKKTKTFDVTLLSGVNIFRATAFNSDRTEAIPDEIKIELNALTASANLYILAIGLNEYKNTRYNLNYGRADAQAFADAVEQRGRGIFKQITKRAIFDADATRANIEAAFNEIIKQARPQDAFVFYFAGHGVMSEGDEKTVPDFYLVPHDVLRIYGDDGSLITSGIAARQLRNLLKDVPAQKQLIVLDACRSGSAVETISMRGAAEEKAIMQLARSAGVAVLASAGQDQDAIEFKQLGHGIFTYALLKGLSGEADGAPADGKITVKELEAYLNDQVPELMKIYGKKRQDPNSSTRGQDFPIAIK